MREKKRPPWAQASVRSDARQASVVLRGSDPLRVCRGGGRLAQEMRPPNGPDVDGVRRHCTRNFLRQHVAVGIDADDHDKLTVTDTNSSGCGHARVNSITQQDPADFVLAVLNDAPCSFPMAHLKMIWERQEIAERSFVVRKVLSEQRHELPAFGEDAAVLVRS
jgi:hypothetical protein